MARTITWEELRTSRSSRPRTAVPSACTSIWIRASRPRRGRRYPRSLASRRGGEGGEAQSPGLTHAQRQALKADFERIRRFYDDEFVRDGARGLAIFAACLDNIWRPLPLTEAVADEIRVSKGLYLAPLVPLVGRGEGALVVAVSRGARTDLPASGRSPRGGRESLRTHSRAATTRAAGRRRGSSGASTTSRSSTCARWPSTWMPSSGGSAVCA